MKTVQKELGPKPENGNVNRHGTSSLSNVFFSIPIDMFQNKTDIN